MQQTAFELTREPRNLSGEIEAGREPGKRYRAQASFHDILWAVAHAPPADLDAWHVIPAFGYLEFCGEQSPTVWVALGSAWWGIPGRFALSVSRV